VVKVGAVMVVVMEEVVRVAVQVGEVKAAVMAVVVMEEVERVVV